MDVHETGAGNAPALSISFKVAQQEYDTILAALRYWQANDGLQSVEAREIAAYNGDPLTYNEIDELIDRLQTQPGT